MDFQEYTTKTCKLCRKNLPLDSFNYSDKSRNLEWRRHECKQCLSVKHKKCRLAIIEKNKLVIDYDLIDFSMKKECSVCKKILTLEYFYKDIESRDGFSGDCSSCSKGKHKKWYENNKEFAIQRIKEWGERNPEKVSTYKAKYARENPEKVRKSQRDFYQNHLEEERERSRKKKNIRDEIIRGARYRARKLGLPDNWHRINGDFAFRYWHYACAVCGKENGMWNIIAFDHWIPIAREDCPGTIPTNMLPLCHLTKNAPFNSPCCNNSKGAKDPVLWLKDKLGSRKAKTKLQEIEEFFAAAKAFAESHL